MIDPTRPLYEQTALSHALSPSEAIIQHACNFIKLTNPKSMYGWSSDDYKDAKDALDNIQEKYLEEAYRQLKDLAKSRPVEFGDYYKLATGLETENRAKFVPKSDSNDWRETNLQIEMRQQQREIHAPKSGSKTVSKYWLKLIKEDLKINGGLVKKLPYDKNVRV